MYVNYTLYYVQNSLDSCRSGGGKSELSEWERMVFVVMCVKAMEVSMTTVLDSCFFGN